MSETLLLVVDTGSTTMPAFDRQPRTKRKVARLRRRSPNNRAAQ
ncbi:MAG TPA: hypothetical protein VJR27_04985 [Candidatus Saccharimonadales bacterium]|nr:hypothetical protein [Candidatus Saccharimonadales bacterium]